jgi:hypothetical protein
MDRITFRTILRRYADLLRSGHTDTDLSPRQRRLAAVVLATASNDGYADVYYPPTDATRQSVVDRLVQVTWNGNAGAYMDAIGKSARDDFDLAYGRALEVIRNA